MEARIQRRTLPAVGCAVLCVPSMRLIQKGFKSPVYKMSIEEQKKLLTMKRTTRGQLREGDRSWEGRLWESHQAMNKKSIRGRRGGMSWHNTAKSSHLAPEVNGTLGWWRIKRLPGEISLAVRSVQAESVRRGNTADDRREVSRSHRSWDKTNWGAEIARLNNETHGTNHPAKG